jgi:Uma2 family endonuclease
MAAQTTFDLAKLLPASFTAPGLTEAQFLQLCEEFPDAFLEYTADGEVIIMPPTDFESGARVSEIVRQLGNWALHAGGLVGGPEGGFLLPNRARRSPDVAWCDAARWAAAKRPGMVFPLFAPDFVIEVRSPGQRARPLCEKMEEYIANGVKLGWLIDRLDRTVTIYRPEREAEILRSPSSVAGEGPVAGFVLDLSRIFL